MKPKGATTIPPRLGNPPITRLPKKPGNRRFRWFRRTVGIAGVPAPTKLLPALDTLQGEHPLRTVSLLGGASPVVFSISEETGQTAINVPAVPESFAAPFPKRGKRKIRFGQRGWLLEHLITLPKKCSVSSGRRQMG